MPKNLTAGLLLCVFGAFLLGYDASTYIRGVATNAGPPTDVPAEPVGAPVTADGVDTEDVPF